MMKTTNFNVRKWKKGKDVSKPSRRKDWSRNKNLGFGNSQFYMITVQ